MKQGTLEIKENKQIIPDVFEMRLEGDVGRIKRPGQFVNIAIDNLYLRRPFSICDYNESSITLLYKIVGQGTRKMSLMQEGQNIVLLNDLGNGFSVDIPYKNILLVGGGIGIAPLYKLAKILIEKNIKVSVALCFNRASEIFYESEFKKLGTQVYVATVDGSKGTKGFITDLIEQQQLSFDYFYACGPMPMLKALCLSVQSPGEVSLEARMGCGFGICMGCSIQTVSGNKRVCKEGPVFRKEEIIW